MKKCLDWLLRVHARLVVKLVSEYRIRAIEEYKNAIRDIARQCKAGEK